MKVEKRSGKWAKNVPDPFSYPAEDVKKIERKLAFQQKKLVTRAEPLDTAENK